MLDHPTDREIESQLRSIPASTWRTLRDHVEVIGRLPIPYAWHGGERDDGAHTMPYVEYDDHVDAVVQLLYEMAVVVAFDWMTWHGVGRYGDAVGLASATGADVARWLTALVRSERFSDGTIAAKLDDGMFVAALERLVRWGEGGRLADE